MAALLAKAGHALARDAVYSRFDRNDASGSFDGGEALVELDELPGLLHVADHVGHAVLTRSDLDVDPHVLWFAQERFGEETVERTMTEAAASNSAIAAYIQALRADRERQAKRTPGRQSHLETVSYQELRAAIFAQGSQALGAVVLDRWGRQANEHESISAATDLLAETDDDRLVSYLRIFRKRAFPLIRAACCRLFVTPIAVSSLQHSQRYLS